MEVKQKLMQFVETDEAAKIKDLMRESIEMINKMENQLINEKKRSKQIEAEKNAAVERCVQLEMENKNLNKKNVAVEQQCQQLSARNTFIELEWRKQLRYVREMTNRYNDYVENAQKVIEESVAKQSELLKPGPEYFDVEPTEDDESSSDDESEDSHDENATDHTEPVTIETFGGSVNAESTARKNEGLSVTKHRNAYQAGLYRYTEMTTTDGATIYRCTDRRFNCKTTLELKEVAGVLRGFPQGTHQCNGLRTLASQPKTYLFK